MYDDRERSDTEAETGVAAAANGTLNAVVRIMVWAWLGFIVLLVMGQLASGAFLAAGLVTAAGLLVFPPLSKAFAADGAPLGLRAVASVALVIIGMIAGAWSASPALAECVEAKIEYFRTIGSYPTLSDGRDAHAVAREQCSNPVHREWVERNRDSF